MRDRLKRSVLILAFGCATTWQPAGIAIAENGMASTDGAASMLPDRTQSVVDQLAAPRREALNVGIVAGAGSLAPHCETPDGATVQSATIAGNIMCIVSRRPNQAADEQAPQTFGEALESILAGPH